MAEHDVCVVGSANLDIVATATRHPRPGELDVRGHKDGRFGELAGQLHHAALFPVAAY